MITLYRLLLECALERQSRTMKEIFDSICNARVSVHYKGFFLVNYRQSRRQGVKMAERNCVGCESITKCVCLKCDAFACNRSLKCSVPASEIYPGWKKVALCFKCDKEEQATDNNNIFIYSRIKVCSIQN